MDFEPEIVADDAESVPLPPLARAESWVAVDLDIPLPDWAGGGSGTKTYRRELNTMPQWAGSCWYYLRYLDPTNETDFVGAAAEKYWMTPGPGGVDLYVGGVEHAVLHLLYARFWHKVLFDLGHVSTPEPFQRLFNQGYILADAFTDERGFYVEAADVVERDGSFFHGGAEVRREHGKMGKSLKNAVAPDEIFRDYGADTLRLYEMFMGPLDASRPWNTGDIIGVHRFLQRLWRNVIDEETGEPRVTAEPADDETRRLLHRTIAAVSADMDTLSFNTAIARLFELNNRLTQVVAESGEAPEEVVVPLVLMTAPLAPHVAEEIWERLGHEASLAYEDFPTADPQWLTVDTVEIAVQLNGKVRGAADRRRGPRRGRNRGGGARRRTRGRAAGREDRAQGHRGARPPGQLRRRVAAPGPCRCTVCRRTRRRASATCPNATGCVPASSWCRCSPVAWPR